ncbi:MAG: hypothetical protein DMD92_19385 [Candidatus Rokuibacteriota bacterium]|nr:MAG: hypothetical protein DMD92_19385 [Candidatus Rokubacteria bacterium]
MNRLAGWLAVWLVVLAAGCAASPPRGQESGQLPRARCLVDPKREAGESTRPLIFLFCIESP